MKFQSTATRQKWSWSAFFLGPFWYFGNGMVGKGVALLFVIIFTLFLGLPFVCIYSGLKARGDLYESNIRRKAEYNINSL